MQSSLSIKPKHDQQLCYPFPQNFTQPHELRENILSSSDSEQPPCSSGMKSPHLTHHNPGVGSSFLLRKGNWCYPGNWCVFSSSQGTDCKGAPGGGWEHHGFPHVVNSCHGAFLDSPTLLSWVGQRRTHLGPPMRSQRRSDVSPQFGNRCVQWPDQGALGDLELV